MSRKLGTFVKYAFLVIASILSVFPLVWMIIAATNKSVDVIAGKLTLGANLIENYNVKLLSTKVYWDNPKTRELYKRFWKEYQNIKTSKEKANSCKNMNFRKNLPLSHFIFFYHHI